MTGPRSEPPMPILTTLRMRLPVWPLQSPLRTRLDKSTILSSTEWTWGTTFSPSRRIDAPRGARSATCRTARPGGEPLSRFLESRALGGDHRHQFVPGFDERGGPFVLKPGGQGVNVDTGLGELRQHLLAVATVRWQDCAEFTVIGEGFQCFLGHGVHRQRRGEGFDIEDVGSLGILGSRTGPQQALRTAAGVVDAQPARRAQQRATGFIGALGDGDAEPLA